MDVRTTVWVVRDGRGRPSYGLGRDVGEVAEELGEEVGGGMWVAFVLAKAFAEGNSGFRTSGLAPATAGFQIFVHTMLSS